MEFFHGVVALLAFGLLVLSGLVAWLYMQQTRLLAAVNTIAIAISSSSVMLEREEEPVKEVEEIKEQPPIKEEEEDDRVSVDDDGEEDDVDTNYSKKTIKELREVLTTRGIPFNKGDKKTDLLSLLAATS
jgi:hypothetical protein